jgi:hypothetical protein
MKHYYVMNQSRDFSAKQNDKTLMAQSNFLAPGDLSKQHVTDAKPNGLALDVCVLLF